MFVRRKTVKGREYYYLVKSQRLDGLPRQKVVKYLGTDKPSEKQIRQILKDLKD